MSNALRKPIDGAFRTWSDGQRVHVLLRLTGGNLGPSPVIMHTTTELEPARSFVRRRLRQRNSPVAGDPVRVERIATSVGAFSALRRLGRAAGGAVSLATAPARALGGAGVELRGDQRERRDVMAPGQCCHQPLEPTLRTEPRR